MRRTELGGLVVLGGLVGVLSLTPVASGAKAGCVISNKSAHTTYPTLQQAADAATAGDTLLVKGTCTGTTTITTDLTISGQGKGATLDGGGHGSVLTVCRPVTLNKLVIRGGTGTDVAATPVICGELLNVTPAIFAGGILAIADVTLNDSSVTENTAGLGGGIWVRRGTTTLNDSTVTSNASNGGAGILNGVFGVVSLNGASSVSDNHSHMHGGGVSNVGRFTMNGTSTVSFNTADQEGGGVRNAGTFTMNDASSIHDNMAGIGGGIFSSAGTLTGAVAGGSVYGNIPDEITVV